MSTTFATSVTMIFHKISSRKKYRFLAIYSYTLDLNYRQMDYQMLPFEAIIDLFIT